MELKFRKLKADEIDCRVQQIKPNGLSLLLYKDARCDQNILDETVGAMNWQRHHNRDNANCIVSIWDDEKNQWVEKEDTGTESRTEKEKGLASDSFKRACFNWGIGRELYTAPFIWIPAKFCNIKDGKCYDRFEVRNIGYTGDRISELVIYNTKTKELPYAASHWRWTDLHRIGRLILSVSLYSGSRRRPPISTLQRADSAPSRGGFRPEAIRTEKERRCTQPTLSQTGCSSLVLTVPAVSRISRDSRNSNRSRMHSLTAMMISHSRR